MTDKQPWAGSTRAARLPADWRKRRTDVLKRDRGLCRINGPDCTHRALEVDHINRGDDHSLANLQAACVPCHKAKTGTEAAAARPRERRPPGRHPGLIDP